MKETISCMLVLSVMRWCLASNKQATLRCQSRHISFVATIENTRGSNNTYVACILGAKYDVGMTCAIHATNFNSSVETLSGSTVIHYIPYFLLDSNHSSDKLPLIEEDHKKNVEASNNSLNFKI